MPKQLLSMILLLALLLGVSGCNVDDDNTPPSVDPFDNQEEDRDKAELIEDSPPEEPFNWEKCNFLGSDGETRYYSGHEGTNGLLYVTEDEGLSAKQLASFPSRDDYQNTLIVDFGICGDWIILSVGQYQGSMSNFFGDFVRLKKDGSELEHFWLTDSDRFVIADGWIYYNYQEVEDDGSKPFGCYRIRPDGTEKEYMGDKIFEVILYAEDGYLYGRHSTDRNPYRSRFSNLIRCRPDGSEKTTLFLGSALPTFEEGDYIKYYGVEVEDEAVTFTVYVNGYREGGSWRDSNIYNATYRVDKDGSNLILFREETFYFDHIEYDVGE